MKSCISFMPSWKCLPLLAVLSCAPALRMDSTYKACLDSGMIPDSTLIDTMGIIGTIVPALTEADDGAKDAGILSGAWTPSKFDVYKAERIFRAGAAREYRCIDSNHAVFFRRYIGKDPGTTILIHATRKSRDRYIGSYRSFWIDVGDGECSGFDALVNIRTGTCFVTVTNGE